MTITAFPLRTTQPRPRDPTGAARQKRYRDKRRRNAILGKALENNKAVVTEDGTRLTITLDPDDLDHLASRIASGPVTRSERYIVTQIILQFMFGLPEDTSVSISMPLEEA